MLVLPADAHELRQTLAFTRAANTPLLTTGGVDPRYLMAMLRELARPSKSSERAQRPVSVYALDLRSGLVLGVGQGKRRLLEAPTLDAIPLAIDAFMDEREGIEQDAVLAIMLDPSSLELPVLRAAIDAAAWTIYADKLRIRLLVPGLQESPWATSLDLSPPIGQELTRYVDRVVKSLKIGLTDQERRSIIEALRGLVAPDIHQILESASHHSEQSPQQNAPGGVDGLLERIERARRERLVTRVGLEVIPRTLATQMGGMEVLKRHLEYDKAIFRDPKRATEQKLALPRGILLVGLPGCGKSLAAKVSASVLDLPLLRLDVGSLMGKYLGESEERMRRALDSVEASAPCVLWIDELEKALGGSTGGEGTGTDTRMLGLLLTWMQENDLGVYVVATANSVEKLPPELLRRGRFDESFFVGLPNEREREAILKIHLEKRGLELDKDGLEKVAGEVTEGFSGAEIEALVKATHRQRYVLRTKTGLLDDLKRLAKHMTPFSKQWEQHREKMERPIREQGFKNASLTGDVHELPPVPKDPVPRALQALLDAPGSVVLRPRRRVAWTMELVVVQERIELRLCQGDRAHVGPGEAEALTTLRASGDALRGRLSSSFAFSHDAPAARDVALESDEQGDVYAKFASGEAIVLDVEFLAPIATGSRGFSEEFPPALYGCLGGAFELELGHRKISFINSGARREAVLTTKQGEEKRYRVRARGASVLLGSLDGESDGAMELVWNGEQVQLRQSSQDAEEEAEARENSDHPVGFQGTFQTGGSLKISPKIAQTYRFSFTNPYGGAKTIVFLALEAGRYKGVVRLDSGDQTFEGKVKGGMLRFAFNVGQGRGDGELTCIVRSNTWSVTLNRTFRPAETVPIEELAIMGGGVSVMLVSTGPKKIELIKTLRGILGLGLKEAKDLAESYPVEIKTGLTPSEARKIASKLRQAGARVEVV